MKVRRYVKACLARVVAGLTNDDATPAERRWMSDLGREGARLSPRKILADFEAGILTRLEREGLLLRAIGQGAIGEFVECATGEALDDVLVAARRGPWTENKWATTMVIGSWCGGEDRAEDIEARIKQETRAGVDAVRAHFGIEHPA